MIADAQTLTVVIAALVVLALGYGVVGAMTAIPATSGAARNIWPILNVEAVVVLSVLVVFAFAPVLMPIAMLALTVRVVWEAAMVRYRPSGAGHAVIWAAVAGAVLIAAMLMPWRPAVLLLGAAWAFACAWRFWRTDPAADLLIFPVLPMLAFATACGATTPALFLAAWIGIETFDSYALLVGKVFGRHKAFPRLSPNKTVEGLVGGAAMLMLTALAAVTFVEAVSTSQAIVFALLIGVFAVVGDLAASRLKRLAGVKDFPSLIPHQGGMFDMFDAWISVGGVLALLRALEAW
ncbi:phosphatidate cytidylyltransferase [Pseudooceanicola sp. LIPI14-2-Ac024]|uniref:phosphatidate cytidylyltransferase n=1 Tax=Pseudooceanicola sp. LIPI14-2-Ac024 TaxID=3344875 RepID=UPI0035D0F057